MGALLSSMWRCCSQSIHRTHAPGRASERYIRYYAYLAMCCLPHQGLKRCVSHAASWPHTCAQYCSCAMPATFVSSLLVPAQVTTEKGNMQRFQSDFSSRHWRCASLSLQRWFNVWGARQA